MVYKRYKYLGVGAISALVSAAATYFVTNNIQTTRKSKNSQESSENLIRNDKQNPATSIPAINKNELTKVKKKKPVVEAKLEPMEIDRTMFPMEFGSAKKRKNNQRKPKPRRNNGRHWTKGDQVQHDSNWDHTQEKEEYDAELSGKSTTELRDYHRMKFIELVVKLPADYQAKYSVNDFEMLRETKINITRNEKIVDASTFGDSLTFLEKSLGKLARAHQLLAGLDQAVSPVCEQLDVSFRCDQTPSQVFNSLLEKTHNVSTMLQQIHMEIVDDEETDSSMGSNQKPVPEVLCSSKISPTMNNEKPMTTDEIIQLDDRVTKHYLAYLDYSHQIVTDWHHRKSKMIPGKMLKIRLKEMTMEEQKEWLKILPADPSIPIKFWYQRLRLFSKYEEGIKLDREGWFSTTPELIAKMIARRMGKGIVLDAMCGAGGNTIQMALHGAKVIANDLNKERLEMCRHNAKVYGVEDRITFISRDVFEMMAEMKAENKHIDAIFLAPPWGGQFYEQTKFDIRMMPVDGIKLFKQAKEFCSNIAMYLPRNVDTNQVKSLSEEGCEIAKNRLYGKVKSVTCYYGGLNMFRKK